MSTKHSAKMDVTDQKRRSLAGHIGVNLLNAKEKRTNKTIKIKCCETNRGKQHHKENWKVYGFNV